MIDETPALVEDTAFVASMRQTIIEGTELEIQFIRQLFGNRMIFGLSYNEMEQYVKYITDRRLDELGFEPHYMVSENSLKFLQKQDLKTLQNFFETTPNQYTNF
jgi:ribonucleoside-diphosphate reductase beta chain